MAAEYKGFAPSAKDWLKPEAEAEGKGGRVPFPHGYEELEASLESFRQELALTTATQRPNTKAKPKSWTSRLIHSLSSLSPGERAMSSARQTYAAYWESSTSTPASVHTLDAAISHFRRAGVRRQRAARALAFGFFCDALDRYESCGHAQADLERALRTGDDAQRLWGDGTNPGVHGVVLYHLAATQQHLYDRAIANVTEASSSGGPSGSRSKSSPGASNFELAVAYFSEVTQNAHIGDLRLLSRIQLGVLVMTRCAHEGTTAGLETCIAHWERALDELNSPKNDTRTASTSDAAIQSQIAQGRAIQRAGITYQLGFAHQLQYRADLDPEHRLQNLTTTIDYFERAQRLFGDIGHPAFSSHSMFALASRLLLRWEITKEQADVDRAKELLRTAQTVENVDEELKVRIARVLTALESEVDTVFV